MRLRWIGVLLAGALGCTGLAQKHDLVEVNKLNPRIWLDLRYATENNFTHQRIYSVGRCFLRRSVAERLLRVQAELEPQGLGLKMYDCYRPLSAQRKLWALASDKKYVADPAKGSLHNRGAAVDLTLVGRTGEELSMPTPYDEFSEKAHRNYHELPPDRIAHRERLEQAMRQEGFIPLPHEWWHFDDPQWRDYPILNIDLDRL